MAAVSVQPRSVVVNSAWNYAGAIATIVVTLVTVPLYLRALGLEQYGVLAVLTAILVPFGVLNTGVTQAAVKYVASFCAEQDAISAKQCIVASLYINVGMGLVGAVACVSLAPAFLGLGFQVSNDLRPDAEHALRLMGGQWLVALVAGNFRGVLEGLRDQRAVFVGDLFTTVLTALLCSCAALLSGKLSWFVGGQLTATVLAAVYWWCRVRSVMGKLPFRWSAIRHKMPLVYGYSSWQGLNALVAVLANVGDRYFIGIVMSAATLGAYNVVLRIQSVARTLFYSVNQALFPAASAATTVAGEAERLVVSATWHVAFLAGSALALVAICGPAFISLWVGPEVSDATGLALRLLIVTLLFEIPSATGSSYLNALSRTRLTALNNIATTVLTLALMFPLGLRYGVDGVAWSGLLGLSLTRAPFHVWMHRRFMASFVDRRDFVRAFYGVILVCAAAVAVISPLFDVLFRRIGGVAGFVVAMLVTVPMVVAAVSSTVAVLLGDTRRLHELCGAVAARKLPMLSPLAGRILQPRRQA